MANTKETFNRWNNYSNCDFCKEDGLEADASAYCRNCLKKICDSCLKLHAKFSPNHHLDNGSDIGINLYMPPCELHVNQVMGFYCEVHECLICKFCKRLDHKKCNVKTTDEAMKDINTEHEFEVCRNDLRQLNELLKSKQSENRLKLENYSEHKGELKSMIHGLREEINEVLSTYEHNLEDAENSCIDSLDTKIHSFESFQEQIESILKNHEEERYKVNSKLLFFEMAKMKFLKKKYKAMIKHVENETAGSESFFPQNDRMRELIQKLTAITNEEHFENEFEYPFPHILKTQKITHDSDSQTDESVYITKEVAKRSTVVSKLSDNTIEVSEPETLNEDEHCSSEEASEHFMIHITTKPFTSIASCCIIKEKLMDSPMDAYKGYPSICMMPDGQVVVCQSNSMAVTILNEDMSSKTNFSFRSYLGTEEVKPTSVDVILLDSKRVAITIRGYLEKRDINGKTESSKAFNCIQIITVCPTLAVGKEIKLNDKCEKIACFDKKIYVYLSDLCQSTFIETTGIEILDANGQLLKTVQLFQPISCFCGNKDGDIIYLGLKAGRTYGCITQDGVEVYSHSSAVSAKEVITDIEGNVLILDSYPGGWGKITILKVDGSEKRVLLDSQGEEIKDAVQDFSCPIEQMRWLPTSFCYNNMDNTILIAGVMYNTYPGRYGARQSRPMLRLYQLQYAV